MAAMQPRMTGRVKALERALLESRVRRVSVWACVRLGVWGWIGEVLWVWKGWVGVG